MTNAEAILATVPIFSVLKPRDLKKVAKNAREMDFPAGTVLTEQDELGVALFVVTEGTLGVEVGGRPVRTLGQGEYFGEMALIDHQPRAARVTAETDAKCLTFSGWAFRPLAHSHPEVAWALLERMVDRVREAEDRNASPADAGARSPTDAPT